MRFGNEGGDSTLVRVGWLTWVFVVQSDADHVMALDLRQRTWTYLRGDSGAQTISHHDGGGHGLTKSR